MTLVVENGTGLTNAESYVSVANADARLTALGKTDWAALSTTVKEQSLRRATAYIEQAYRSRWKGTKSTRDQALSWPRWGAMVDGWVLDGNVIPTDIANACAELALTASAGDLNANLTRAVVREKVGPLETEYAQFGPESTRYRALDMALAPYLTGGGGMSCLSRA